MYVCLCLCNVQSAKYAQSYACTLDTQCVSFCVSVSTQQRWLPSVPACTQAIILTLWFMQEVNIPVEMLAA
jgi:hypothetical protein